jgi:hypothetical protein
MESTAVVPPNRRVMPFSSSMNFNRLVQRQRNYRRFATVSFWFDVDFMTFVCNPTAVVS